MSEIVIPFIANGVITAKWGAKVQSYQVLELRIFDTKEPWSKVKGPIAMVLKGKKNVYKRFSDKAEQMAEVIDVDALKKELESSLKLLESANKRKPRPVA